MTIKIGPVTSRYQGTVRIEEADDARPPRGHARAGARRRGQGTAAATITPSMRGGRATARACAVETDLRVTGPAAQFGRGVMQDVSARS